MLFLFFFKQKTAYEMCGRDWSSDVCSSDLLSLSLSLYLALVIANSLCDRICTRSSSATPAIGPTVNISTCGVISHELSSTDGSTDSRCY